MTAGAASRAAPVRRHRIHGEGTDDFLWRNDATGAVQIWNMANAMFQSSATVGFVNDVFALHLVLLYALSILARYRPAVWQEVVEGELDQYRSLIAGYYDVFQRVVPELALKRISDRPVAVTQPGSFFAPT